MVSLSPLAGPRLHVVTAVVGADETRRWVDVVLPTLAAPGNLGACSDHPGDVLCIHTTPRDRAAIEGAPVLEVVRGFVEVRFVEHNESADFCHALGWRQSSWRRDVLAAARNAGAAAVFLPADAVVADGGLARLRQLAAWGVKKVWVSALAVEVDSWTKAARRHAGPDPSAVWALPPRAAVSAAWDHLHDTAAAQRWDADAFDVGAGQVLFPLSLEPSDQPNHSSGTPRSWVAHAWRPYPVMEAPDTPAWWAQFDAPSEPSAEPPPLRPGDEHLVTDSDTFAMLRLMDAELSSESELRRGRAGRAAAIAEAMCEGRDPSASKRMDTPVLWHDGDVSDEVYSSTLARADAVLEAVRDQVRRQRTRRQADAAHGVSASPTPSAPAGPRCRLHFMVPVWGRGYIERFLRWGLPSFLAEGNLPATAHRTFAFDIVTDEADRALFADHPAMDRLASLVDVRFLTPDAHALAHPLSEDSLGYAKMTRYYNAAIQEAAEPDVAHVFLTPEGVFSDGMFTAIAKRFDEGFRAVALPGFRVLEDTAIEPLLDHHVEADGVALSAAPRDLVRWLLRHPHPITQAHTCDAHGPRLHPHYYFPVGPDGFVAHCFHIHPVAVWPTEPGTPVPEGQTLDHEYLANAVPLHMVHQVRDTDEMAVIDIARGGHLESMFSDHIFTADDIVGFALEWTNGYQRAFYERGVRVHTGGIDERWVRVESFASGVAAEVLGRVHRTVEMPVFAQARAALAATAQLQSQPWLIRHTQRYQYKRERLRQRVDEVGWLRALAVRTRLRRKWADLRHHLSTRSARRQTH